VDSISLGKVTTLAMSTTLPQPTAQPKPTPAKSIWPRYPNLYEINTWVWLSDLSVKYGKPIDLASVPSAEWDAIAAYGFDAVWLMGVWERSPAGIAIANKNPGLLADFRRALPDFRPEDNVGSAYAIRRYVVDQHLGGPEALAAARNELVKRGMNLLLDFVPNHVAPDNPWASEHPDYFINGTTDEARNNPGAFISVNGIPSACGRDPYFAPWPDVLQLNAFNPKLRQAVIETLSSIAGQCDGVRCDMAMLVLNSVFERTWGTRVGPPPPTEYWTDIITAIRNRHPGFLFIAEAYWDLEWQLQQLGFDFCYDKKLYDRLEHGPAESVRLHLCADMAYQNKLLRFIENHDEPRAAATFSPARERAVAIATLTLPGARLYYEGQLEGRKVRPPVFLSRRPQEPVDHALHDFYAKLLAAANQPLFHDGEWRLCDRSGWPNNASFMNLVAWTWQKNDDRRLIAVNLGDSPLQALVHLPWTGNRTWNLADVFSDVTYRRDGNEMASRGLYVELAPWASNFFRVVQAGK
jgi:Alpha amylase, catalytic domain